MLLRQQEKIPASILHRLGTAGKITDFIDVAKKNRLMRAPGLTKRVQNLSGGITYFIILIEKNMREAESFYLSNLAQRYLAVPAARFKVYPGTITSHVSLKTLITSIFNVQTSTRVPFKKANTAFNQCIYKLYDIKSK